MPDNSNIADVMNWLRNWLDDVNFTRPGQDQSLGRDIAMKVVERIAERGATDHRGVSGTWDDNEPKYAKWKEVKYGVADGPNLRTGQMLSQKSLYGKTLIESHLITMKYGTGEAPDRAVFGGTVTDADKKVTDQQKAYFAHTGQSAQKIKRPFYEVDESDGAAIVELAQANINEYIRATNAANGY